RPAGAALLGELAAGARAGRPATAEYLALALADLGMADSAAREETRLPADAATLARSSSELAAAARRAIQAWQDRVMRLVHAENMTKRSVSRVVSFDHESLALVLMISVLGAADPELLLASLFGAGQLRELTTMARLDLSERVSALFEPEVARFAAVIDAAVIDAAGGDQDAVPVPGAAADVVARLLAASERLEGAR
ncbi:MAG: hypothetical protein ACRDNZ_05410, partial [Streptosporangiaceae bacterium]